MIRELMPMEIDHIYEHRMKEDFPPDELRPLHSINALIRQDSYFCLAYERPERYPSEEISAYAFFARLQSSPYALLDYYAVSSATRGQGIGSKFLMGFQEALMPKGIKYILLEVERPDCAATEAERQIRMRRIQFYLKNGCYDTDVLCSLFGVDYHLMLLPFSSEIPTAKALAAKLTELYRLLLSPLQFTAQEFAEKAQVYLNE